MEDLDRFNVIFDLDWTQFVPDQQTVAVTTTSKYGDRHHETGFPRASLKV